MAADAANCTATSRPPGSGCATAPCWASADDTHVDTAAVAPTSSQRRSAAASRPAPASMTGQW
ncbi:hypothetical protein ABZS98_15645 [Streptomyces avermitilis]|uniref:hypothetical protein n=1 Tax=Streptomyces avermitilis TaxID=33903 RepID=UPI0033ABC4F3